MMKRIGVKLLAVALAMLMTASVLALPVNANQMGTEMKMVKNMLLLGIRLCFNSVCVALQKLLNQ